MSLLVLTRVCTDDFDIFQIWSEYYLRHYSDIRCCIHRRPTDDVSNIISFCEANNINYELYESETFDNKAAFSVLRNLSQKSGAKKCLVIDCDEFIDDFEILDGEIAKMTASSIVLKSVDRCSYDLFFDISECETYEDLCAVAPLSFDLSNQLLKWPNHKCCVNTLPNLGEIYHPSNGMTATAVECVTLNHFRWTSNWTQKARRQFDELKTLGETRASGLEHALSLLADGNPRKYLTIPGQFEYHHIYSEQCRALPNGAILVELGVWKGRSLAYLAECAQLSNKKFQIYGVDLFGVRLSNRNVWRGNSAYEVKSNLEWRGLQDSVTLLKATTTDASLLFPDRSVDFVWLDASHGVNAVTLDLAAWWPKVKAGGTIGGHVSSEGVSEALAKMKIPHVREGAFWVSRDIPENRPTLTIEPNNFPST